MGAGLARGLFSFSEEGVGRKEGLVGKMGLLIARAGWCVEDWWERRSVHMVMDVWDACDSRGRKGRSFFYIYHHFL